MVAAASGMVVVLSVLPGSAHTSTSASEVEIRGVEHSGSTVSVEGDVSSSRSACLSRRIVLSSDGRNIGAGRSDTSGRFSVEGTLADANALIRATATKKTLKRTSGHSHTCRRERSATASAAGDPSGVDLTALPVGDGRYSTSPRSGYIYSCQTSFNGGGAGTQGPWFNGDGTWDLTKKVSVDGSVNWAHELAVTVSGDSRVFSGNNLPNHPTGTFPISSSDDAYQYDRNPNSISDQDVAFTLDATPTELSSPECVGGAVGYMLTGGYLFNGFDAGGRDAVAWEVQDRCDGHPQNTGVYHYHSLSSCAEGGSSGGHSALLGYAFDGFGVYGRFGADGELVTNDDLDACHGRTHPIQWDGATRAMYHYHSTYEFPYSVGCFRGDAIRVPGG